MKPSTLPELSLGVSQKGIHSAGIFRSKLRGIRPKENKMNGMKIKTVKNKKRYVA